MCLQFSYEQGSCKISRSVLLGKPSDRQIESGSLLHTELTGSSLRRERVLHSGFWDELRVVPRMMDYDVRDRPGRSH